jgi:hypothetical protein
MREEKDRASAGAIESRPVKGDHGTPRRKRIESLKQMIDNEEYVKEAITKLAKTLTSGLMQ